MKSKKYLLIMVIGLITAPLTAQTPDEAVNFMFDETGVGVKAQGMGNAFVAVADDYTATYWNPAGLTMLKYSEISGDMYHLKFNTEANFSETMMLNERTFTKFSSLGLAYKFPTTQGSFALSFGYNRFKDFDDFMRFSGFSAVSNGLEFELQNDDGSYQYYPYDKDVLRTEEITQNGNLSAWSIGGGLQVSENLAIGLTMNFYSGSSYYVFDFYQDDVDNIYNIYPGDFDSYELHQRIDSDFSGWGAKLGAIYHLSEHLRLGGTIEFPTTLNVLENYSSGDVLVFDDGYASEYSDEPGEWEYEIQYPFKFSGGIALDLNLLLLSGSFDFRDWTQAKFAVPDGRTYSQDYADLLDENRFFPEDFRSVFSYAAGAELRVPGTGLRFRGGYRMVPSAYADASDADNREYISVGFGYDAGAGAALNFALTKGFWKRNSYDGYTPSGTMEDVETTRVMAGLVIRL